jgi:phosphatidylinositol alpha-1,6-mannosyltransferase
MAPTAEQSSVLVAVLAPDVSSTGGIQRAVRALLQVLADLGLREQTAVLTVWQGHGWPEEGAGPPSAPRSGRVPYARQLAFVRDALAVARRRPRAMLICHPHLAPIGLIARRTFGVPYLVWCHGKEAWAPGRTVRAGLRGAKYVVAGSRYTADRVGEVAGLDRERLRVISYCLPPRSRPEATTGRDASPIILTAARLEKDETYKGIDTLIYAMPAIHRTIPEARLVVVGDGSDRARLERLAGMLDVADAVEFTGRIDDDQLRELYATATVFAMPSRFRLRPSPEGEGFGLVYIEAGAAGLPVVAGRGGGVGDAVIDGETGLMTDASDPTEVASAVTRLLGDRDLARRLGDAGRARAVDEFAFERFRSEFAELLGALIDELPSCAESSAS